MIDRKNPGCAFGPCNDSKQVGGPGCHLCDDIATLPQKRRGASVDDAPDASMATLAATPEPAKKRTAIAAAPKRAKRPTTGSLF